MDNNTRKTLRQRAKEHVERREASFKGIDYENFYAPNEKRNDDLEKNVNIMLAKIDSEAREQRKLVKKVNNIETSIGKMSKSIDVISKKRYALDKNIVI